jgi:hypothetical protein
VYGEDRRGVCGCELRRDACRGGGSRDLLRAWRGNESGKRKESFTKVALTRSRLWCGHGLRCRSCSRHYKGPHRTRWSPNLGNTVIALVLPISRVLAYENHVLSWSMPEFIVENDNHANLQSTYHSSVKFPFRIICSLRANANLFECAHTSSSTSSARSKHLPKHFLS